MKKIVLVFSVIFMLSVIGCISVMPPDEDEENGRGYTLEGSSVDKIISLDLSTSMHLPKNRVNDFLPTLKIMFEKSGELDYYFALYYYDREEIDNINSKLSPPVVPVSFTYFSANGGESVHVENVNFDKNVTDTKDEKYYTMFVLMNGTEHENSESKKIEGKVYFRQLEDNKPATAVMIMLKSENENYDDYLVDMKTGGIQAYKYKIDGEVTPLPNYLK